MSSDSEKAVSKITQYQLIIQLAEPARQLNDGNSPCQFFLAFASPDRCFSAPRPLRAMSQNTASVADLGGFNVL